MGTNIMVSQVKTPIQNYFEKVLYENLTLEIPPFWFFRVVEGLKKIVTSPCDLSDGKTMDINYWFIWE
jgi:hypothetical protein